MPWTTDEVPYNETFKWTTGIHRYEIHCPELTSMDVADLVPHCVKVRNKIKQVATDMTARGPSYFQVFPRTISPVLRSTWDTILAQVQPPYANNEVDFDRALRAFIAAHATEDDRQELVQQLRAARKPRDQSVYSFVYRVLELNDYVDWLPGTTPQLTEDEGKQAFFDAMPQSWRERYEQVGHNHRTMSSNELIHYFRKQESLAQRRARENQASQRRNSRDSTRRNSKGSPKTSNDKTIKEKTKSRNHSKDGKSKKDPPSIPADAQCPVHPDMPHTWGECFNNPVVKAKRKKSNDSNNHSNGKDRKDKNGKDKKKDNYHAQRMSNESSSDDNRSNATDSPRSLINDDRSGECHALDPMCLDSSNNISFSHHFDAFGVFDTPTQSTRRKSRDEQSPDSAVEYMSYMNCLYSQGEDISEETKDIKDPVDQLDLKPIGIILAKTIQSHANNRPLKTLFDTGSDQTFIHRRALPPGANGKTVDKFKIRTLNGVDTISQRVTLQTISLPEFSPTKRIDKAMQAYIYDAESPYDLIVGRDLLVPLGIDVLCSTRTIKWQDAMIPWQPASYLQDEVSTKDDGIDLTAHCFHIGDDPHLDFVNAFECYTTTANTPLHPTTDIKEAQYEAVDLGAVAQQQTHLSHSQRTQLHTVLKTFEQLFNGDLVKTGTLGTYKGPPVHLELLPDAKPFHTRPYPVPERNKKVFKAELERLCDIGVLSRTGPSEWLSPTFIIPKKDGRVRWVSDFRALNRVIKRKVYTLPRIHDILKKRSGYKYFTKIDISMQYYAFELDDASKDLCTICTPFGNYRYNRLPMGVKQSPDIAQETMENLLRDLEETDVYIDDVGIFSNSWEDHIASLQKVLSILQSANFTVNPIKCEWGVQETDWLGYWLTPTGLKPWKKKIKAILALEPPQTVTQLRSFIGAVTFYRDMFPKRSHVLAPLTAQVGKKKLQWTDECQQAFDQVKAMLSKDAFIRYPDHNKPFHVYCDASDLQLGAAIFQDDAPVAYYSRKLNSAQRNYTVGEKELLSIVETLKEHRTMLFGCKELHVHTDHKNLTYTHLQSQRVMRWRLFLEEYAPIFHYIKGETNSLADALSRLPISERQSDHAIENPQDLYRSTQKIDSNQSNEDYTENFYSMAIDDEDLADCFVHLPQQQGIPFVFGYENIARAQAQDAELQALRENEPNRYVQQLMAPGTPITCYIKEQNAPWKIYLPNELLDDALQWYHLTLSHVGSQRLYDTMSMHFYNKKMKNKAEDLVSKCDACQRYKLVGRGHGETPPREAALLPWREIAIDLIGPWVLHIGPHELRFVALTMIDMATNLVELVRLDNKSARHVALQFENNWLARYPWPVHVIHDQGGEFIGHAFQTMLRQRNIQPHATTTKNPQANAVCERMHQVVGNALRVLTTLQPPADIAQATQLVDTALANAVFATRATYHGSLQTTPGGLAFHRDMVHDLPLVADLQLIQQHKQQLIDRRLITANQKRFSYDYNVGDEVLKLRYKPDKLEPRADGPYTIERVHANGTLTIRLSPTVIERISLRRVKPYRR